MYLSKIKHVSYFYLDVMYIDILDKFMIDVSIPKIRWYNNFT